MSEVNGADKKLSKEGIMSLEMLRAYIMHCKSFNPCMTKESESVLTAYYQLQRRKDQQNTTRTTIRLV